ncbi:MAG: DMT family transporter [Brucellaceae bacterium]|jgi:drug/metabolite transporter (DMT)-like permease|nr:DMT family transporter [Brucellaceae bacterium]
MRNPSPEACSSFSLPRTYAMLVLVSVIWGGTFVAGRFLAGEMPPPLIAALRFLLASITLAIYLLITGTRLPLPNYKQWASLAFLGFFGIFTYNIFFFLGLQSTEASRASLIIAINPAMIAIAASIFLGEQLSKQKILGIFLSLFGAGTVIMSRGELSSSLAVSKGDILILGCVASWVIYSVFSPNLSRVLGPFATVTYSIWLGTAMLVVSALFSQPVATIPASIEQLGAAQWISLIYLGAFGSALAYILYYEAIRRVGAMRSGAFIALNPITGVFFGWLLFSETITSSIFAGGIAVIAGICAINWTRK